MIKPVTIESYMQAEREVEIEEGKKSFQVHAVVFVVANVILALVNIFLLAPEFYWFVFALAGWTVGLLVHYLTGYRRIVEIVQRRQSRIEARAKG